MPFGIPIESGSPVIIKDEGLTLTNNVGSIDFVGNGVTGSVFGNAVTENIPGATGFTVVSNEVPSGAIDGSNTVFTLAHTPLYGVQVVVGGSTLSPKPPAGGDYTLVGPVITLDTAPPPGSIIVCFYEY